MFPVRARLSAVLHLVALTFALSVALAVPLGAAVHGDALVYQDGSTLCKGYLAYDDAMGVERRPGILIAPAWHGLDDYARHRAEQFAGLGYVALALDPYGDGRVATDDATAGQLSSALKKDRPALRARGRAALHALESNALTAHGSIAAIGYCFGGTLVLELARDGAPLRAVIGEHAGLAPGTDAKGVPIHAEAGAITAKILVLQGGDDPFVPPAEVSAFCDEMRAAKADWELVEFGGAVHAFSDPKAGSDPSTGHAYDAEADRRAWDILTRYLADLFPR